MYESIDSLTCYSYLPNFITFMSRVYWCRYIRVRIWSTLRLSRQMTLRIWFGATRTMNVVRGVALQHRRLILDSLCDGKRNAGLDLTVSRLNWVRNELHENPYTMHLHMRDIYKAAEVRTDNPHNNGASTTNVRLQVHFKGKVLVHSW